MQVNFKYKSLNLTLIYTINIKIKEIEKIFEKKSISFNEKPSVIKNCYSLKYNQENFNFSKQYIFCVNF